MPTCISPFYVKSIQDYVPCGKCNFCIQKKRTEWAFRNLVELRHAKSAVFLTLTYDDRHVVYNKDLKIPSLEKTHVQKFFKRLRQREIRAGFFEEYYTPKGKKVKKSLIRYFGVGEYGSRTHRPHYHYLIYNISPSAVEKLPEIWQKGFTHIGSVTEASIHYTTKYLITKKLNAFAQTTIVKPFMNMSKRPAIGYQYLEKHALWHKANQQFFIRREGGYIQALPRYYKDRIFNRVEKDLFNIEMKFLSEEAYQKELKRLSKFEKDAFQNYEEQLFNKHELIMKQAKKTSIF